MERLKKINESLPDLFVGILVLGLLCLGIPIWFLEDKLGYVIGLLIGIGAALFMAYHMADSLNKAFDFDEMAATKQMQKSSGLRYGVCLIILGVLILTGFGNPIAAFVGMYTLKVAAYLSPFTHKLIRR